MESHDVRLEALLRRPEPTIDDNGFTESVLRALPRRRARGNEAGRWTLGGAALAGGLLTALFGPPLDSAFGSLAWASHHAASMAAVLLIPIIAASVVWKLYSE